MSRAAQQVSVAGWVAEVLARGQLTLPGFASGRVALEQAAANANPLPPAPMQRVRIKASRRAAGGRAR